MRAPLLSDPENGTVARTILFKGPDAIFKIAITVSLSAIVLVGIMHGSSSPSILNQPDELIALKASPLKSLPHKTRASPGYAVVPPQATPMSSSLIPRTYRRSIAARAESDPIGNPFIKAINALQQGLQNSPLAEGKKLFAKMQAGDYNVEETRAKLEQQISTSPCIMYSFST